MVRIFQVALAGSLIWMCPLWAQKPSDTDAAALIERSRHKALEYSQSLPDFMCTEVVRRFGAAADGQRYGAWKATDTLSIKLRYSQQREDHKLELIDGKPTTRKYEELEGGTSTGEFGGVLRMIFDPNSEAVFDWQSWKTVRKHRVAVYEYAVSAAHSPYYVRYQARQSVVGIHGGLEIDAETAEVLHFTYIAYEIPPRLNLQSAVTSVDYEFADVGGRSYLLPVRSESELHGSMSWARNKMEFREYRKFSADSMIDFGVGK